MSALDEVISTVIQAREDGPDALAAVAMSFGATMVLGTVRNRALRGQIAEMRAAMEATEATVATLRDERDAASAAAKAARQRMEEVREQCDRARDDAEMFARQRDEARSRASMLEQDLARAEVWQLRESVEALRARAERAEAERDRAVQEREAFSLRLSAAERARDEARAALDLARESAREAREEIAQSLALVDEARAALDAALARPTYEARTTMPTPDERGAHLQHGARWLRATPHHVSITHLHRTESVEHLDGATWIPLGASGLPCAWPVVP